MDRPTRHHRPAMPPRLAIPHSGKQGRTRRTPDNRPSSASTSQRMARNATFAHSLTSIYPLRPHKAWNSLFIRGTGTSRFGVQIIFSLNTGYPDRHGRSIRDRAGNSTSSRLSWMATQATHRVICLSISGSPSPRDAEPKSPVQRLAMTNGLFRPDIPERK